jgi:hypothetical protein
MTPSSGSTTYEPTAVRIKTMNMTRPAAFVDRMKKGDQKKTEVVSQMANAGMVSTSNLPRVRNTRNDDLSMNN